MKKLLLAALITSSLASANAFELKILHINDHHSHIEADTGMDLMLGGKKTRVAAGGMGRIATMFDDLGQGNNVLKLHAGDAITGDIYYTLTKGESDAAVMNQLCFDAFVVGNHEFDGGDTGLKNFLDFLNGGENSCGTPVLGANVEPEVGVSPLTPTADGAYLKPYIIKEVAGEKIGIIGIVIADKTKNSSSPDKTTMFLDEIETSKKYINELKSQGVGKIVLLTHNQYLREVEMAKALPEVDIIVGGDSHTLLGEGYAELGLNPKGSYPTVVKNADGDTACVVQAWQYSTIVGELDATFDGDRIASCAGTPHMALGDSFKRKNSKGKRVELTGDDLAAVKKAVEESPLLSLVAEKPAMKTVVDNYAKEAEVLKQQKVATVSDDLCLERIPGQGYRDCDTSSATQGSDITGVVSAAFRYQSLQSDFALQNAGGVREPVKAGEFTTGDAYKLLPFANTLVNLKMSGQQVKDVLEEALEYAYSGSTGAYPYGAGIRFDVNGAMMKGNRFSNIEVQDRATKAWSPIDFNKEYTVVTNSYIAGGKDGYKTFGEVAKDASKIEDTYLDYAQAFVDYATEKGTFGKLPTAEYSTKSYSNVYHSPNKDITGIWWDPNQSGKGVTLKEGVDGKRVVGSIYTYESTQPVWYNFVMTWETGVKPASPSEPYAAKGDLFSCTGSPAGTEWNAGLTQCKTVGGAELTAVNDQYTLVYSLTGAELNTMNLTPFVGVQADRQQYDNLYWDSAMGGQGLYLTRTQSNDAKNKYVGTWYRYDKEGKPTWFYLDGKKAEGDAFAINYELHTFKDGEAKGTVVGTATFTPAGRSPSAGELKYELNGEKGTLNLTGFDFK